MHSSSRNISDSLQELLLDFFIKLEMAGVRMKTVIPGFDKIIEQILEMYLE